MFTKAIDIVSAIKINLSAYDVIVTQTFDLPKWIMATNDLPKFDSDRLNFIFQFEFLTSFHLFMMSFQLNIWLQYVTYPLM